MSSAQPGPRRMVLLGGAEWHVAELLAELTAASVEVRSSTLAALAVEVLEPGTVLLLPLLGGADEVESTLALIRRVQPAPPLVVLVEQIEGRDAVLVMRHPGVDVVFLDEGAVGVIVAADRLAGVPAAPRPAPPPPARPSAVGPLLNPNRTAPPPPTPRPLAPPAPPPAAPGAPPPPVVSRRPLEGPELPILDERTVRLQELLQQEDASFPQVEELIAQEPTLVAALLRTANSAYYRTPKLITNLHDAVVRVGVRHSLTLILQWLLARAFVVPGPEAQGRLRALWANATLTARLTRRLAEWENFARPDDAYLAALLHNVGEAVLLWELYRATPQLGAARFVAEGPRIASHHEAAGRQATERWGLPPLVQAMAGHHHHPRLGEPPRDAQLRLATLASWNLARELLGEYLPGQPEADSASALDAMALAPASRARLAQECTLALGDVVRHR